MRLALSILGTEVFAISLDSADDGTGEFSEYVDCGTTGSTVVGFSLPPIPHDADGPVHQNWPDGAPEDT
jgi:hypothetical protein